MSDFLSLNKRDQKAVCGTYMRLICPLLLVKKEITK